MLPKRSGRVDEEQRGVQRDGEGGREMGRRAAHRTRDTCQLRSPDTQRLLNYDRAKLVSIKVINFEFNNSRGSVDTLEQFSSRLPVSLSLSLPAKERRASLAAAPVAKLKRTGAHVRLRATRYGRTVSVHAIKLPAALDKLQRPGIRH